MPKKMGRGDTKMDNKSIDNFKEEQWYIKLCEEGRFLFDSIYKYHAYFSSQDKKYRNIVRFLRVFILLLSMANTIVLGLKTIIDADCQIVVGLVISALITFVTAILSYFNFEEYWMRNITIHIDLNILRDNFLFEAKAGKLNNSQELEKYKKALEELQKRNTEYWQRSLKKLG